MATSRVEQTIAAPFLPSPGAARQLGYLPGPRQGSAIFSISEISQVEQEEMIYGTNRRVGCGNLRLDTRGGPFYSGGASHIPEEQKRDIIDFWLEESKPR
jgi:hypothetical protein